MVRIKNKIIKFRLIFTNINFTETKNIELIV